MLAVDQQLDIFDSSTPHTEVQRKAREVDNTAEVRLSVFALLEHRPSTASELGVSTKFLSRMAREGLVRVVGHHTNHRVTVELWGLVR